MPLNGPIDMISAAISKHLDTIGELLPGFLLTFVARFPKNTALDMVITNDDMQGAAGAIERAIVRELQDMLNQLRDEKEET